LYKLSIIYSKYDIHGLDPQAEWQRRIIFSTPAEKDYATQDGGSGSYPIYSNTILFLYKDLKQPDPPKWCWSRIVVRQVFCAQNTIPKAWIISLITMKSRALFVL
jgi:hypothetical protein